MNRSIFRYFSLAALLGMTMIGLDAEAAVWDLKNSSFEMAESNNTPTAWEAPQPYFQIEKGAGRNGSTALRWHSNDTAAYPLAMQSIPFEPNGNIEFSAWVKTEDVQGGNATICVEWDKAGQYLGGDYTHGINGTSDWTRISIKARIPDDAETVHVTCYCTHGAAGTAWFDDLEIKPWIPPFLSGIGTDHYRHITNGEPLKAAVGITTKLLKNDISDITDPIVITGDNLSEPISVTPDSYGEDTVYFTIETENLAPGTYTATFTTIHPITNKDVSISRTFTRVEAYPEYKTTIDTHRRAIVDGKPFFPLGLYFLDIEEDELAIFADSAFNCLMPYCSISRENLDWCQDKNIKVIYSVKDNYPGLHSQTIEEGIEMTKNTVAELKDHPAIFAWYINDELPVSMLTELTDRRDLMEELDPSRPTWVVLYQIDDIRYYIPTCDVIGTDPYPISNNPPARAGEYSRKTNNAVFRMQANWQVPQIFNWASYKKDEEKKDFRAPTYEEMRSMAWMNIAGGANGLIFYSWFDLWKMDKTVEEGGKALVREPFDERWADVKKMAAEIADHFPILLSDGQPQAVSIISDNSNTGIGASVEKIMLRLYGLDGKTYALLVNTTEEDQTVELAIPADTKNAFLEMGGNITAQTENSFTIELKPLEPAFVVLEF